jgi:hypothetical protein
LKRWNSLSFQESSGAFVRGGLNHRQMIRLGHLPVTRKLYASYRSMGKSRCACFPTAFFASADNYIVKLLPLFGRIRSSAKPEEMRRVTQEKRTSRYRL